MPTIVLLPGHLCDERAWRPVALSLAEAGHAVASPALDSDDTVDAMARRVLAQHAGPMIPIGFSMGAIVALAVQRAAPERVVALCLANVNAGPDLPERAAARHGQQDAARAGRLREIVDEQMLPHYFAAQSQDAEALGALCLDMAEAVGADAFVRQSEALRLRPDARPGLAAIACPTLVLGAQEDRLCPPEWHADTAAAIPGSSLEIIPDAGHMALLERSDAVADAIIRWLERITPGATQGAKLDE